MHFVYGLLAETQIRLVDAILSYCSGELQADGRAAYPNINEKCESELLRAWEPRIDAKTSIRWQSNLKFRMLSR
jgi:hypothetical protein